MHSSLLAVLAWVHSGSHTSCISKVHDNDYLNALFGQTLTRDFGNCYVDENCAYSHYIQSGTNPHYSSTGICYFLLNCNATVTYSGTALDIGQDNQARFEFLKVDGASYTNLPTSFQGSNKNHIFDLENQTMIYWSPDSRPSSSFSFQKGFWSICLSNTPTESPTRTPTSFPTKSPTESPTRRPTDFPTESPTKSPTRTPTDFPTESPTKSPTRTPTDFPTESPTKSPSVAPPSDEESEPDAALIGGIAGGVVGAAILGGVGYYVYTQKYALTNNAIAPKIGELIF